MPSIRSRAPRFHFALASAALLALGLAGSASAEGTTIYRWIDEHGVAHYTAHLDRVPRAVRGSVQAVTSAPATSSANDAWAATDSRTPGSRAGKSWDEGPSGGATTATAGAARSASAGSETRRGSPEAARAGARDVAALDERIAALEQEIDRDQDAIRALLSEAPAEGATPLRERPEMREIAQRLPRLQADLRALREQRGRIDGRP